MAFNPAVSDEPPSHQPVSFAAKADLCESDIFARHLQHGLLIPQVVDPTGALLYTHDNCGLRTGVMLSALSLKWSVTREPEARARAAQTAAALRMLETVTGVPGMTARQYKKMQGPGHDEHPSWLSRQWHQGPVYRWLGNVSTDEMTWFLAGLADYVLLCAEGRERARSVATINRVVGRMLDHGMRIVEADGRTTTWGDCSRESAREPLFCLHGLHYLKVAEVCTDNPRFAAAYEEYASDAHYLEQAVHCYKLGRAKRCWADYDWELATPGFDFLLRHDSDPARRDLLTQGLLEMAAAPNANLHPHLCTATFGLGGKEQVREWLAQFDPQTADGVSKGWYHWIYWEARSAGIITPTD